MQNFLKGLTHVQLSFDVEHEDLRDAPLKNRNITKRNEEMDVNITITRSRLEGRRLFNRDTLRVI